MKTFLVLPVAALLVATLLVATAAWAQTPAFEVASVKPSLSVTEDRAGWMRRDSISSRRPASLAISATAT